MSDRVIKQQLASFLMKNDNGTQNEKKSGVLTKNSLSKVNKLSYTKKGVGKLKEKIKKQDRLNNIRIAQEAKNPFVHHTASNEKVEDEGIVGM
jgi:hypothetical protein